ncbi:MAG: 2-oxo acid dehydrogenase subunit E2 [Phycisphaerae bacterium]|nr:2-oxo acid dehydrogenase subunit E2 [Phycisphaerae bacterium]
MPTEITMPQLSDTMTEGTVVKWLKKEGDKVKSGEIVAEVETDKANMEMESFEAGTLAAILVQEGGKVPVGQPIALLASNKEDPAEVKKNAGGGAAQAAAKPSVAASAAAPATTAPPSGASASTATIEHAASSEVHEPDGVGHQATRPTNGAPSSVGGPRAHVHHGDRIKASPLARKIAEDTGVDLTQVRGTGPNGRIVQADVLSFKPAAASSAPASGGGKSASASMPPAAPLPARVTSGQKEVVALTKMRSAIAAQLLKSKQSIPHFYETIDIDVEDVSKLRERINKSLEAEKIRISIGDLIAKAVATALIRHPMMNATFNGTEITKHGDVNLGLAVALPEGLIVPVLRGVDQMGLKEIRLRSADLVDKARAGKLKQDERTGATFTVSNLGTYGIREFSAIVNPPEVGILAIAAAEKRAVVRNDQIVARTILTVTLSCDHRVVDGALAAEFLRTLKQSLEEPGLMLV